MLPVLLITYVAIPFAIGGMNMLICVIVALGMIRQLRGLGSDGPAV